MPQTAPSLLPLGGKVGSLEKLVALGQAGWKSHSSMHVLEMKEPSPFFGLRGEGEGKLGGKSRRVGPGESRGEAGSCLSGEISCAPKQTPPPNFPQHM